MSRPAAVIARTQHPDYLAAQAALEKARDRRDVARGGLHSLQASITESAMLGQLPSEAARQDYYGVRMHYEALERAVDAALTVSVEVRSRLGLAR